MDAGEDIEIIRAFVADELSYRRRMRDRYPENNPYWTRRVEEAAATLKRADRIDAHMTETEGRR